MTPVVPPGAAARLLFPAVRWDAAIGDWDVKDRLDEYAELGVGGYIVFGGPAAAAAELTARLRSASGHPILVGADLERGAGQQFAGATALPPAAALASLDDLAATRQAGYVTAREATALGVDWAYAPVADLDVEPANPIVGTRSFGADAGRAAGQVAAWIEGCQRAGALACAKHFPGHGRTTADSHLGLPAVAASARTLDADLTPFRAAIAAGVDGVMTAHVAFPALDPTGAPATLSAAILRGLLRERLAFDGLVVTDALIMEGARGDETPEAAAVRAVTAGCDVLLYPPDPEATARALEAARGDALPEARLAGAVARIRRLAETRRRAAEEAAPQAVGRPDDLAWALDQGVRSVRVLRGDTALPNTLELVTVDDDLGGPYPAPSRSVFPAALAKASRTVLEVDEPSGTRPVVVAVYADVRGFKGRPGLSAPAAATLGSAVATAAPSLVVLFGHPRLEADLPGDTVVCAWGGEALMQEAAAMRLTGGGR